MAGLLTQSQLLHTPVTDFCMPQSQNAASRRTSAERAVPGRTLDSGIFAFDSAAVSESDGPSAVLIVKTA